MTLNKPRQISPPGSRLPVQRQKAIIEAFPNNKTLLEKLNPDVAMMRYSSLNTPRKCLESNIVKLWELKEIYNIQTPLLLLEAWIINLNDSLNVEPKMTSRQVSESALLIYEDFYFLNIAEITYIFKGIKKGEIGKVYNRLDCNIIIQCCYEYKSDRTRAYQKMVQEQEIEKLLPVNYSRFAENLIHNK